MSDFLDFVKAWAGLISGVFGDYPFAAAIITLVAVGLFLQIERHTKNDDWTTRTLHFFIALVAWAIVVPILGFVFNVIGFVFNVIEKLWSAGSGIASGVGGFTMFLYHAYEKHPLLILALLAISVIGFFVWHFARPSSPSRLLKALACVALFSLSVIVGAPIVNMFSPSASETATESVKPTPVSPTAPQLQPPPASSPPPALAP